MCHLLRGLKFVPIAHSIRCHECNKSYDINMVVGTLRNVTPNRLPFINWMPRTLIGHKLNNMWDVDFPQGKYLIL